MDIGMADIGAEGVAEEAEGAPAAASDVEAADVVVVIPSMPCDEVDVEPAPHADTITANPRAAPTAPIRRTVPAGVRCSVTASFLHW
jgi:hypothetical protein